MMDIIRSDTKIDFMARRKIAMIFSAVLILISIGSLATRGLEFGLDFTGGTLIEVSYPDAPDLGEVRGALDAAGYEDFTVQTFGTSRDIVVRLPADEAAEEGADISTEVLGALESTSGGIEMRRVEFVGPQAAPSWPSRADWPCCTRWPASCSTSRSASSGASPSARSRPWSTTC